ncbi:TVP38/TMEM64 family protein [Shouchella shacheensis]|uniref:TVP38/TMEM64 family protein n=1 Tax=Shouchella shacheensis TaxID=1649580 RepID=UPI00073FD1A0|nr:TVP38/TMEM64 family protein [Shouchella shacheensis]
MGRKIVVLLGFILLASLVLWQGESMVAWMRENGARSFVATSLLATLLALFPVIPYPIIGGVLGAVFGTALGSLATWIGSSLASVLMFAFIRYGYQDWGLRLIHKSKALTRVTRLFERNAFMTIFLTRLIPIIPSIIVNAYSALSRVTFASYTIASSLGKVPSMILFATVGSTLVTNPANLLRIAFYYAAFLLIVYGCFRLWNRYVFKREREKQTRGA